MNITRVFFCKMNSELEGRVNLSEQMRVNLSKRHRTVHGSGNK